MSEEEQLLNEVIKYFIQFKGNQHLPYIKKLEKVKDLVRK